MNKKRVLIALIIIIALAAAGVIAYSMLSGKPLSDLSPSITKDDVPETGRIKPAELVTERGVERYYNFEIEYPRASAELADIGDYVKQVKDDFIDMVPKTDEQATYDGVNEGRAYVLKMDTTVYTSSTTITYKIETYMFTGGAHGGSFVATFTYGQDGKPVSLSEILRAPDSLDRLSSAARSYFKSKLGDDADEVAIEAGTQPLEQNFASWYVTDTAVTFIFQQYQIGSYALGLQEFPLSRNEAGVFLTI